MKPFEVSVDPQRRQLNMVMRGFWDMATFDAFAAEFVKALHQLHRQGGALLALVDGREFAVQSKDVLGRFGAIMQENGPLLAKRTASVVPAELNRMQSARVAETITNRHFTTLEEAEAWLNECLAELRRTA
jgi:hypothetical protein